MNTMFNVDESTLMVKKLLDAIRDEAAKIVDEEIEKVAEGIKQKAKIALKSKAMELTATLYESVNVAMDGRTVTFIVRDKDV